MTRTPARRSLPACLSAAVLALPLAVLTAAAPAEAADNSQLNAAQFKGVNWARPGDNFVNGPVVPEGLTATDGYATVKAKADVVFDQLRNAVGPNTVRLPINTFTYPGTSWGNAYAGVVDSATAKGLKVILSFWEDGAATSGGRVTNKAAFDTMWNAYTAKYASNGNVHYEIMNEPIGYNATDWANFAAGWIAERPSVPRERIVVSGVGYNDYTAPLCTDSRFDGTYLSAHLYAFGSLDHDYQGWIDELTGRIGSCATRTILDEWGAPQDDGLNYHDANSTNDFVRYVRAMTDSIHNLGLGSVYWPAIGGKHQERPTYDYYSLFHLEGSGTNLLLRTRNTTMTDRLRYAWGLGAGSPTSTLRNTGAQRCLDIPGATHANLTQVEGYTCHTGANQQWTRTATGQITAYNGAKCLDAVGQGTADGTVVDIYDCNTGSNQKWAFYSDGTIRGIQSGKCLDLDLTTSKVILYTCHTGTNQKWQTV
ncbi:hypothetical protein F4556_001051 [Kitasatospora gansuensis]|uniref:Ricin B lectin domain-containing protein n=1 Tax=Kitasatospora gansuensis TaxID=258050 RepID=A0A7W7S7T9_9ACTN|nr:ricin-type beta-trefoil lectin domain protein [Kitasatospora gansuensis]MBB4945516.1 hypothetical protein [Kitasatospora gansuensis]